MDVSSTVSIANLLDEIPSLRCRKFHTSLSSSIFLELKLENTLTAEVALSPKFQYECLAP